MTAPLTGPFAGVATTLADGARAYFTELNKNGGLNGHKVTFTVLDSKNDPATGVSDTKQLIQSGEIAQLAVTSNVSIAIAPVAAKAGVPLLIDALSGTVISPPVDPHVFAFNVVISSEARAMISFAKTKWGKPNLRVACLTTNTAVTNAFLQNCQSGSRTEGWNVVSAERVPLEASDANAQATTVAASHPDVVFMALSANFGITAASTLRSQGYKGPIIDYATSDDRATMQRLADPDFYVMASFAYPDGKGDQVSKFSKVLTQNNVDPWKPLANAGYVAGLVLTEAMKRCNATCTPAQITKILNDNFTVDTGGMTFVPWKYTSTDHRGVTAEEVFYLPNGKGNPVAASGPLQVGPPTTDASHAK